MSNIGNRLRRLEQGNGENCSICSRSLSFSIDIGPTPAHVQASEPIEQERIESHCWKCGGPVTFIIKYGNAA
ncbi:MAG: hypothetical protein WBP93_18420 [Pyrinomonadaceae bacterium]